MFLLVCEDSRFTFSDKFSYLLVSQMEDHLDEKDIAFKPRQGKGKNGKKKYWPDSSANNIIYCLDQCEGNCANGLMMFL